MNLRIIALLAARLPQIQGLARGMWWICCLLLALGVLTVVLQAWDGVLYDTVEDAFEWVLSLLLQANFLLGYLVWRRSGWQLQFVQPKPVSPTRVNQEQQ